ncbi:MAG TPA: restriction endonuclease, partial [Flavisolibacter sp.]|nr:restriction endonuclease [Flavisolibacter sp.]
MKPVHVIKAFGRKDLFSEEKLRRSLRRSGVGDEIIREVIQEIIPHLKDGTTTRDIYKQAFQLLKQYSRSGAARYKLKQAINELGPSGFPFELYVAELLRTDGYTVQTGVVVQGHCVKHEIDVVAEKDDHHFLVECKFHNSQGIHSDVKIPLYIQSRFLDVTVRWKELQGHENKFHQAWLVTNTRFTE